MTDQTFAAQVTAALASELVKRLFDAGSSLFKRTFAAPARATALEKATAFALDAALSSFDLNQVEFDHFQTIFTDFLRRPGVLTQLENVIHPQPGVMPSRPALKAEFIASGGDPEFLPAFAFDQFISSFIAAFYDQASTDPELTTAIQINLLRRLVDTSSQSTSFQAQSLSVLQDIRDRLTAPSSSQPPPIPHQIPSPPDDLTGRESVLKKLNRAHTAGKRIFLIHGFGGIGKTALSYALACDLEQYYPDAQIKVDLLGTNQSPMPISDAMAHVIRAWHPEEKIPENQQELVARYQSVLHGKHVLLLFDNARDLPQIEHLIPPIGCCLLVTSRFFMAIPGQESLDLDALSPQKAVQLIRKIVNRIDKESASILAEYCAYIPLALRVSSGALSLSRSKPISEFLSQFKQTQSRLYLTGMDAALQVSYDLLPADLQAKLRFLSVFPAPFDRPAAIAIWDVDQDTAQSALDSLVNASLLDYDETTGFRLHDLLRVFTSNLLTPAESYTASYRHSAHYYKVGWQANILYLQGSDHVLEGLRLFDLHWAHLNQGQAWVSTHSITDEIVAKLCYRYPSSVYNILPLRLNPEQHIAWLHAALSAACRMGDKEYQSYHLGNLGLAYADLGQVEKAIDHYQQALVIAREIGDRRGEGNALGNLGLAYADLGQVDKAIDYHQQALLIAREIGDRRGEGNTLGNLGLAYANLGQVDKGIEIFQQVLAIARETGDRLGEGTCLGNLGAAYGDLGQAEKAIDLLQQALLIAREIGDRRGEGNTLGNLGTAYYDIGQVEKAIDHYQQVLLIAREISGRLGECTRLGNLGNAYSTLGQEEKAIEHYQQALLIAHEVVSQKDEGIWLSNLGDSYFKLGQLDKAIEYIQQSLVIARKTGYRYGEAHRLNNLAEMLESQGDLSQAVRLASTALAIYDEIKSPEKEEASKLLARLRENMGDAAFNAALSASDQNP
jgi:tetratricopeptide (TPR) repeat protein